MSFNYTPKIVLRDINSEKLFSEYNLFSQSTEYQKFFKEFSELNTNCQFCFSPIESDSIVFGTPVSIRETEENGKRFIDVESIGTCCSFQCSYKKYLLDEQDRKKNIKFTDSGTFFQFLLFYFFKEYDYEKHSEKIDPKEFGVRYKTV